MRLRVAQIFGYGFSLAAILAFAAFLVFALVKLIEIERDMRVDASENMLWVIAQTQRESLRLDATAARRAAGLDTGEELALRFDMLLSRLSLLAEGPQARVMAKLGFAEELAAFTGDVIALEPLLQSIGPGDTAQLRRFAAILDPLNAMLGRAANVAMVAEWNGLGERLDASRHAIWLIIASVIGIMLAGMLLSAQLLMTLKRTRRAEHSLRREKQFSELLVDSSGEGILAIGLDGCCTVWNPAMESLIPIPAVQALGVRLADISGLFEVEGVHRAIGQALAGKPAQCPEQVFFPHATAEARYLDLLFSPLRNEAEVVGAIIFVRDVTEHHAAQRALRHHRAALEDLVDARTADLVAAQKQLMSTMQDLERALERERGVSEFYRGFAGMVSHQFRTPLAIIDSNVQRLVRRGEKVTPEEIAQRAARIRAGITRLTRLVESTLDAARLDTGQIEVKLAPCDFSALARVACARQHEVTPERKIVLEAPDCPVLALCDPALVEHILANLLSNAVKYSPSDSPVELRIGTDGAAVRCAVRDRGVGVPPEEAPRLFERFFRASTASGVPGTGIGLNLSRSLARLQGGDVTMQSRPGEGSTFTLILPRAQAEAIPEAAE
ncbi:MAG TPA: PAS domain-containing protein [Paracoccus sp.]|nr:PAS domain-containing protein [Paracoccus sp. (in: a-proteobacteria)]